MVRRGPLDSRTGPENDEAAKFATPFNGDITWYRLANEAP